MDLINYYNSESFLPMVILIPLMAAIIPLICNKNHKASNFLSTILCLINFVNIINILIHYMNNGVIKYNIINVSPDLKIAINTEPLGLIFALMASLLWCITNIYASGYIRTQNFKNNKLNTDLKHNKFFAFMALSMCATFIIALAANLFTLFLAYELLTIFTYPLITISGTEHARKSGRKYLLYLLCNSIIFLLPAIIAISHFTNTLDFTPGGILKDKINDLGLLILLFCCVFGTAKTAIMPIHKWLPVAMVAPTPVSALLHAVAVVKAGIFTIIKLVIYIFGLDYLHQTAQKFSFLNSWLAIIAALTIILSSLIALKHTSLKKILAYSTIGQLSYCILAISIFTPQGIIAAIFHMIAHAFSKITLFFAAGSIYISSYKTDIKELDGLAKLMPYTCFCFSVCAFSIIGVPPLAAFVSKYYILSAINSNLHYSYLIIITITLSTALNIAYLMPIIYRFYFKKCDVNTIYFKPPNSVIFSLLITTSLTILLVFSLPNIFDIINLLFNIANPDQTLLIRLSN